MATEKAKRAGRQTLQRLVKAFPPPHPVKMLIQDLGEDCWAETYMLDEAAPTARFIIRMQKGIDDDLVKGTLAHEYAHVLAWFWDDEADHGPAFGLAYACCWQFLFD